MTAPPPANPIELDGVIEKAQQWADGIDPQSTPLTVGETRTLLNTIAQQAQRIAELEEKVRSLADANGFDALECEKCEAREELHLSTIARQRALLEQALEMLPTKDYRGNPIPLTREIQDFLGGRPGGQ